LEKNPEQPPFASINPPAAPSLGYYGRGTPARRFRGWRGLWFVDALLLPRQADLRGWWLRRLAYYAALFVLFLTIGFYIGPNEFLFHRVLYPYHSISDYGPEITTECVPLVRAVKEYQRDYGRLPEDLYQVMPGYLPSCPLDARMWGDQLYFVKGDHLICYDFTPGSEGWSLVPSALAGSIPVTGRAVPAPLVSLGPSTRPTPRPTSAP
jgi:hypothetical protein